MHAIWKFLLNKGLNSLGANTFTNFREVDTNLPFKNKILELLLNFPNFKYYLVNWEFKLAVGNLRITVGKIYINKFSTTILSDKQRTLVDKFVLQFQSFSKL